MDSLRLRSQIFLLFSGLLDTITSTADSKDCPGVCVHALATIICYDVLEDVACPSPSMKCCVHSPGPNETDASVNSTINYESTSVFSTTTMATSSTTVSTTMLPSSTISSQVKHKIIQKQ